MWIWDVKCFLRKLNSCSFRFVYVVYFKGMIRVWFVIIVFFGWIFFIVKNDLDFVISFFGGISKREEFVICCVYLNFLKEN